MPGKTEIKTAKPIINTKKYINQCYNTINKEMTFPYKTTLMDSAKDGLFVTTGIVGGSYGLKLVKIHAPIKFGVENILLLYGLSVLGCFLKDVAVEQKWIAP